MVFEFTERVTNDIGRSRLVPLNPDGRSISNTVSGSVHRDYHNQAGDLQTSKQTLISKTRRCSGKKSGWQFDGLHV